MDFGFCFKIYDTFYLIYNNSVKEWRLCAFPSPARVGRQFIKVPIGGAKSKLRCLNTATDRKTVPGERGCVSLEFPHLIWYWRLLFARSHTMLWLPHWSTHALVFSSAMSVTQGCYSGWFLTFNGFSFTSPLVNAPYWNLDLVKSSE